MPATRTVPELAGMKHDRIRIVVLLPAPLGPSNPTTSPLPTVNDMLESAVWPAYRLVKFPTSIINPSLIRQVQQPAYPREGRRSQQKDLSESFTVQRIHSTAISLA
jgi:hypothetical protein